jgi:hypothetical protein
MNAKYEKTTTTKVAVQQTHLNESQCWRLAEMLGSFGTLFNNGKLGHYPHQQVHLEVEENDIPIHTRAYPVAKTHENAFKTELKHFV